jgi:microcystin degradation protein MlrC
VLLHEISDNPGSGASGDATHLLRAIVEAGLPPGTACFGMLCDPDVAAAAHAAGVGATMGVALGGKHAPGMCGEAVRAQATVLALSDGKWVLQAFTVSNASASTTRAHLLNRPCAIMFARWPSSRLHSVVRIVAYLFTC